MDTACVTSDHLVLVRGRGWIPITRVAIGDHVWSLQFLGHTVACWSRVTGTTTRAIRADEELVHFTNDRIDLLVTTDHQMWTWSPSSNEWRSHTADEVHLADEHVVTCAPSVDCEPHVWEQAFATRDDDAWCQLIGAFLNIGRLHSTPTLTTTTSSRNKCVLLEKSHAVTELLQRLNWLTTTATCDEDAATSVPRFSPSLTDANYYISSHAALYDFFLPMLHAATPSITNTSPSHQLAMQIRDRESTRDTTDPCASHPLSSLLADFPRPLSLTHAYRMIDPSSYESFDSDASSASSIDILIQLHGSMAFVDAASSSAPTRDILRQAYEQSDLSIATRLVISHLSHPSSSSSADDLSHHHSNLIGSLRSGARVILACGASVCRLYDSLRTERARYLAGQRCYRIRAPSWSSSRDTSREDQADIEIDTIVIEAPDPLAQAPGTLVQIVRALVLAQQFIDRSAELPSTFAPPSAATVLSSQSHSQSNYVQPAEQPFTPAHTDIDLDLDSPSSSSPSSRSIPYDWRFELSPRQCRNILTGWMNTAPSPSPSSHHTSDGIPLDSSHEHVGYTTHSDRLRDDLMLLAARAGWSTVVRTMPSDKSTTLVDKTESTRWSITFSCPSPSSSSSSHLSSSPSSSSLAPSVGMTAPLVSASHARGDIRSCFVRAIGHKTVHCLTVESGNFLVRRDAGGEAVSATAFIGNCGTPSYTCPEQIMGRKYIGNPADVWSLGVILFAMISGFLPFESSSIPSLFRKIKNRAFRFPDYMSKEAQDMIGGMLTVDPEKRSTIAELRNHPWFMMEYTELADLIEAQKPVTPEMIAEARQLCVAVGDDTTNSSNHRSNPSGGGGGGGNTNTGTNAHHKYGHKTSSSVSSNGGGTTSKVLDDLAKSSGSTTTTGDGSDEKDSDDKLSLHGASSASSGTSVPLPSGGVMSGGHAMAMGMRPRERVPSNGSSNGLLGGTSKPATAKGGFRDRSGRASPPTMTATTTGTSTGGGMGMGTGTGGGHKRPQGGSLSIFDKLSMRSPTSGAGSSDHNSHSAGPILSSSDRDRDRPSSTLHPSGVGLGPPNSRFPRFNPSPSNSDGTNGGVRFPPIGTPSSSPLPSDGNKHRVTGRASISGHSHEIGTSSTLNGGNGNTTGPSTNAGTRSRRPSEFSSNIPSYMQPTENAQNHLLASEREEREKEAEAGGQLNIKDKSRKSNVIHCIYLDPHIRLTSFLSFFVSFFPSF